MTYDECVALWRTYSKAKREEEYTKCKSNLLYFIYNYAFIPEGIIPLKYGDKIQPKSIQVAKALMVNNYCIHMASRQLGKFLILNEKIPLQNGLYTTVGQLKVGDMILGDDGLPTKILAITDTMYNKTCYKLEFDYANPIIAGDEHLWEITFREKTRIVNTEEIIHMISDMNSKECHPYIKVCKAVENIEKEFIIHPYMLGLWLGNGSHSSGDISTSNLDQENIRKYLLSLGYDVNEYRFDKGKSGTLYVKKLITLIRKLKLYKNKHIPDEYLSGSIEQRLELVRGLMDSDGYCTPKGKCEFYQKRYRILEKLRDILSSLGIKSRVREKIINNQKYYTLLFSTKLRVFNLPRKIERQLNFKEHPKNYRHYIKSITSVESQPCKCLQVDNESKLFLCGDYVPTHNSTIAAVINAWAVIFFPTKLLIINMNKDSAYQNLDRLKFVIDYCPSFLTKPDKNGTVYKESLKKTIELNNGSFVKIAYPSSQTPASRIGRGDTLNAIYIDESSHIKDMGVIWSSCLHALSKGRPQAIAQKRPWYVLTTSTPNGVVGTGEWFANFWVNSLQGDNFFDKDGKFLSTKFKESQLNLRGSKINDFIGVRYHWSENPTFDDTWYENIKRNEPDERKFAQEVDLSFGGASNSIFKDSLLQKIIVSPVKDELFLESGYSLNFYDEIDPTDYYLIGIDSAESLAGDYCVIEIFGFREFNQVAEFREHLSSIPVYKNCIKKVIDYMIKQTGGKIILVIETNNMGGEIVNRLEEDGYDDYFFNSHEHKLGFRTSAGQGHGSRSLMCSFAYQEINNNPSGIKSFNLKQELSIIERKGKRVEATKGFHDDCFMATAMCAFARNDKYLEIMPKISKFESNRNSHEIELRNCMKIPFLSIDFNKTNGMDSMDYRNKILELNKEPIKENNKNQIQYTEYFQNLEEDEPVFRII